MIREVLGLLAEKKNLTREQARAALVDILTGAATPAQIAAFATALKLKGETAEEITGCATAMREHMVRVQVDAPLVLDTCGTGGDGKGTLNISTVAALVAAAGGITVAKHGNRAASSKSGSADLFEQFGVKIDPPLPVVQRCLAEAGIAFLFAPNFHPALKHAAPVRKELGFRTIFNLLGPLCNPAGANVQTLGVPSNSLMNLMASSLISMGSIGVMTFCSFDGMDEISPCGETAVLHATKKGTNAFVVKPEDAGLSQARPESLLGGDPAQNAKRAMDLLKGEKNGYRDAVVLNAAACFVVTGGARNLRDGAAKAAEVIDSGRALATLKKLAELSHAR
jgi:anthranilate phosphoribosyltransferase